MFRRAITRTYLDSFATDLLLPIFEMAFITPFHSSKLQTITKRKQLSSITCYQKTTTPIQALHKSSQPSQFRLALATILSLYCTNSISTKLVTNLPTTKTVQHTHQLETIAKSNKSTVPLLLVTPAQAATLDNGVDGKIAPSLTLIPSEDEFETMPSPPQFSIHEQSKSHSIRDRVTVYLQKHGISDSLVVFLISSLPVLELRAGIPAGFLLNLPPLKTLILAVCGNIAPIVPILLLLRIAVVQRITKKYLSRARKLATKIGNANSRAAALALFVGIPLPGTGAWTASLIAFVLGMPFRQALASIIAGVLMAAFIVTALCAMGKLGAVLVASVLIITGLVSVWKAANNSRKIDRT